MRAIQRLMEGMMDKYGIYVPLSEIGYESHLLYKEEIDEQLVPAVVLEYLAGPLETESASYTDHVGTEYLVILVEMDQPEPYEVWLVDDEVQRDFLQHGEVDR